MNAALASRPAVARTSSSALAQNELPIHAVYTRAHQSVGSWASHSRTLAKTHAPIPAQNGQPRQGWCPARAVVVHSAKGPISRILSCAVIPLGAALPRTLISDLPGGFGHCMEQPPLTRSVPAGAALRCRAGAVHESCSGLAHPSLFGLAPCGVYPATGITAEAVRSYRTISPLPRRWS